MIKKPSLQTFIKIMVPINIIGAILAIYCLSTKDYTQHTYYRHYSVTIDPTNYNEMIVRDTADRDPNSYIKTYDNMPGDQKQVFRVFYNYKNGSSLREIARPDSLEKIFDICATEKDAFQRYGSKKSILQRLRDN